MLSTLAFVNNDKEDKTEGDLEVAALPSRVTVLRSLLTKWHVSTVVILRRFIRLRHSYFEVYETSRF